MSEYRVMWQQCPFVHHPRKIVFVEADSVESAKATVQDHVERTYGIGWFEVRSVELYERPVTGRVINSEPFF